MLASLFLSLAMAGEPDTLAGVTVGSTITPAEWGCASTTQCITPGQVAGVSGHKRISKCGNVVSSVYFYVGFNGDSQEELEAKQLLISRGNDVTMRDPVGAALSAMNSIHRWLMSSGWTSMVTSTHDSLRVDEFDYSKDGAYRTLKLTALKAVGRIDAPSVYVSLATPEKPCTDGL